jgi:hypothetical protein
MVATVKVTLPSTTAHLLSMFEPISTGSLIMCPNTLALPAVTTTTMIANRMGSTGRTRKLPIFMSRSVYAKREKSPKFKGSAAKYAKRMALPIATKDPEPVRTLSLSVRSSESQLPFQMIQPISRNITM